MADSESNGSSWHPYVDDMIGLECDDGLAFVFEREVSVVEHGHTLRRPIIAADAEPTQPHLGQAAARLQRMALTHVCYYDGIDSEMVERQVRWNVRWNVRSNVRSHVLCSSRLSSPRPPTTPTRRPCLTASSDGQHWHWQAIQRPDDGNETNNDNDISVRAAARPTQSWHAWIFAAGTGRQ